jgi:hypothetical protein
MIKRQRCTNDLLSCASGAVGSGERAPEQPPSFCARGTGWSSGRAPEQPPLALALLALAPKQPPSLALASLALAPASLALAPKQPPSLALVPKQFPSLALASLVCARARQTTFSCARFARVRSRPTNLPLSRSLRSRACATQSYCGSCAPTTGAPRQSPLAAVSDVAQFICTPEPPC